MSRAFLSRLNSTRAKREFPKQNHGKIADFYEIETHNELGKSVPFLSLSSYYFFVRSWHNYISARIEALSFFFAPCRSIVLYSSFDRALELLSCLRIFFNLIPLRRGAFGVVNIAVARSSKEKVAVKF